MVNLNKNGMVPSCFDEVFVFVVFTTASPAGADGGSGYLAPAAVATGCTFQAEQKSVVHSTTTRQLSGVQKRRASSSDLSVFSLKTACVCSACRRPVL